MAVLEYGETKIHYEEFGSGYPVLLFAPGSLQSTIAAWHRGRWDPTVELASEYRVIAMDQRNSGESSAPIRATDGWQEFLEDHIALLDHLGIQQTHLFGACIGVSFALRLIKEQPARVSSAVLQQPIGANQPRTSVPTFDSWRTALPPHPEANDAVFDAYRANLYDPLFVYSVDRDFVRSCDKPCLILPGNDEAHPFEIAKELDELLPNAEFIPEWRDGDAFDKAFQRVHEFLRANTPRTE